MNRQDDILNELKDLQSGLPYPANNPQAVPPDYFDGLPATVLAKVKAADDVQTELVELSPLLAGLPKSTPFTVPNGFFEKAVEDAVVITQETEAVSPLLQSIGKEMPYSLPEGYFETLPATILAIPAKPQARVVPLFAHTWMRVAAAAVIAGALVVGGLQLFNTKQPEAVASTPVTDTVNAATARVEPTLRQKIGQASTKELEEFVEAVQAPASGKAKSSSNSGTADFLKDISATEMERFLSSMPSLEEEGLLTD